MNMRLRYFLSHPEQMKGRHELMQVLNSTNRPRDRIRQELADHADRGGHLDTRDRLPPIAVGVYYSLLVGDVSDEFTIAGA